MSKQVRQYGHKVDMARTMPYLMYLMILTMLYIGNAHYVGRKVRAIEKLRNETKELNWIYMTAKSDVIHEAAYSRVEEEVKQFHLSNKGLAPRILSSSP